MFSKKIQIVDTVLLAIIVAIIVKLVFFQTFMVESESMVPTLYSGDRILCLNPIFFSEFKKDPVTKQRSWVNRVSRNDIVVFKPPLVSDGEYVKRVIVLGNEKFEIVSNQVRINDKVLDDPHAWFSGESSFYRDMEPMRVPNGNIFVMGDNRDHSSDSRSWGSVSAERVEGKAVLVFWPMKHFKLFFRGK